MKKWSILGLLIVTSQVHALVDYGEETSRVAPSSAAAQSSTSLKRPNGKGSERPRGGRGLIELTSGYQTVKVSADKYNGKLDKMDVNLLAQTPFDLFLELGYWQGRSSNGNFSESNQWQKGNMKGMLGITWLKWGGREDENRVNLLVGGILAEKNSSLATSRNDKILGVETTKNISSVILGLGGEYRLVGTPDNETETRIGNISKATAAVGLIATSDIRFALEATYVKVAAADQTEDLLPRLKRDTSFSVLSPKVHLNVADYIQMQLGANFRTKKPDASSQDELIGARLWEFPWAFGNSLVFGMGISI